MNVSLEMRARIIGGIFIALSLCQVIGVFPGLEYLAGAFPTHFHKTESIIIICILFVLLSTVSFVSGYIQSLALIALGALMFYSSYKVILNLHLIELSYPQIIWSGVTTLVTISLAWIVLGSFKKNGFGWKRLFFSLLLANFGFLYLGLIAS